MFNWEKWIESKEEFSREFERYLSKEVIKREDETENLSISHIKKVDYNLDFVGELLEQKKFYDWIIVGCYYSIYHATLALLVKKGFSSKNHQATLCGLIHLYYKEGLEKEDIELVVKSSIDKEEVSYFVEAKNKRESASYKIGKEFTKNEAIELKDKTILFVNKIKEKRLYTKSITTYTKSISKMIEINGTEKRILKTIFIDYTIAYNSFNIKDKIGVTVAYINRALKRLSEKKILLGDKKGNATFYKPRLDNPYVIKLLELIFTDNSDQSNYVKGWIQNLQQFNSEVKALFIFGSILTKGKNARDVDVCFVLKSYNNYGKVEQRIKELNKIHKLKIHPLHITEEDFIRKLKESNKPLINMVKNCVVVHGQETFVRIVKDVTS